MSRYYQLIVFLTVYCIKNNCDQLEPSSYQFLCKNIECNEPIGKVQATQNYYPDSVYKLRFSNGDLIDFFGSTSNSEYFLAKIGDQQGLISSKLVKEVKRAHKDDLVATSLDNYWKPIPRNFNLNLPESGLTPENPSSHLDQVIVTESPSSDDLEQTSPDNEDSFGINEASNSSSETISSPEPVNVLSKESIVSPSSADVNFDSLETSFANKNNVEGLEPVVDVQKDQIKTPVQQATVKAEEITKSRPVDEQFNISPSLKSHGEILNTQGNVDTVGVKSTTELYGTKLPIDALEGEGLIEDTSHPNEISMQTSTLASNIEVSSFASSSDASSFTGAKFQIEPSSIQPSIESSIKPETQSENLARQDQPPVKEPVVSNQSEPVPNQESKSATEPIVKDPLQENLVNKTVDEPHSEKLSLNLSNVQEKVDPVSSSSVTTESPHVLSSPSHSFEKKDVEDIIPRHDHVTIQQRSADKVDEVKTGFDQPSKQPSETEKVIISNETPLSNSEHIDGKTDNYFADSNNNGSFESETDFNKHSAHETVQEPQVNQDHSPIIHSSQNDNPNVQNVHQPDQLNMIDQLNKEETKPYDLKRPEHEMNYKFEAEAVSFPDQIKSEIPPNPQYPIRHSEQQFNYQESQQNIQNQQQQQPVPQQHSQQPKLHQHPHQPELHHHQHQQQYQQPQQYQQHPSTDNYNSQTNLHSVHEAETTRQMAADVDESLPVSPSSLSPPSSSSLLHESIESASSISPDPQLAHLSESNQNFDSNLALSSQSSLHSNSADPSDQSSFNVSPEPLTDSFTQTFTETPVPTDYPDSMRSQIALLTTLLPEPVLDYLKHINFSPAIFVILLIISFTWLVMFITSRVISSHKEKVTLEDQLCHNHGENFKLKTERDYLFDELAAEKEKNARLSKEHSEMLDKFKNINSHVEHSESERSELINKIETLANETRKQKQKIEQLEKNNETLKDEVNVCNKELDQLKDNNSKLSKELDETTEEKVSLSEEIDQLKVDLKKLEEELESYKNREVDLLADKEQLSESLESIEKLKLTLEEKEQEINSMKLFIEEYHKNANSNESIDYSLDALLDGIKLKAELNSARNQSASIKEEKDYLSTRMAELEIKSSKAEKEANEAIAAKEEAERRLQILKTYFNEQEVKLQAELGTWKLKHEEILAKNESVPGYIEDLRRSNESLKSQVAGLEREIAKREDKHRTDCSKLEREKHELYMLKIRLTDDLKKVKTECEILRKKLTLKSQGYSDDDVKQQVGSSSNLDTVPLPPPPPPGYLEDSLDSSISQWPMLHSMDEPPPPFPVSWMTSNDSSGYNSLPPAPMTNPYPPPPSHHHYPIQIRDTFSPSSQRSHDQRSVRSDISYSSANNSHHHYSNFGAPPPPALPPVQGSGNPLSHPPPAHWSVNTQLYQHQTQNESTTGYDNRNYHTSGR